MSKQSDLREEMIKVLEDFSQSGLTRLAYCEQKSIAVAKFYYWQKKLRDQSGDTPDGFIRLTTRKNCASDSPMAAIVLQYPNGISLQLPAGTPVTTIRTLLSLA
jgi:hypothetical protein